jgi:hypothetical protein
VYLNLPGNQGALNGQRTGDEIEIDHYEFRVQIANGDTVGNVVRLIHFQAKGEPSWVSNPNQILANDSTGAPGVTSMLQFEIEKTGINVLSDQCYVTTANGNNQVLYKKQRINKGVKKIVFQVGTANVTNGQTFILYISDSFITPHPTIEYVWRVYYRDV